jgi:hypothetical protein
MTACPTCGNEIEPAADNPRPGDFTVCVYCRVYLILTPDMAFRLVTNREWLALPPEVRKTLSGLRDAIPMLHDLVVEKSQS